MVKVYNKLKMSGICKIEAIDRQGKVLSSQIVHNKVVNTGIEAMLKSINNGYTETISTFHIGSGTTPAAASDTALETEEEFTTGVTSKALDSTTYPEATKVQHVMTIDFTEGNGVTLTELGLFFSDATTMMSRFVFQPITKNSFIKIVFTYTITGESA